MAARPAVAVTGDESAPAHRTAQRHHVAALVDEDEAERDRLGEVAVPPALCLRARLRADFASLRAVAASRLVTAGGGASKKLPRHRPCS